MWYGAGAVPIWHYFEFADQPYAGMAMLSAALYSGAGQVWLIFGVRRRWASQAPPLQQLELAAPVGVGGEARERGSVPLETDAATRR